ncbi:MAG TPA: SDR family NAD(P)-dependent oxidoreductase [Streptosporangiaceae bacterium]
MPESAAEAGRGRRVAVVTGATGGIGIHVAAGLVAAGHQVLVTGRDQTGGETAVRFLRRQAPGGQARFLAADHLTVGGNLRAAGRVAELTDRVDVLVNNVGGLFPERVTTADGLEATLALNFVAAAALTGRLLPLLSAAPAARCVNVVSSAFQMARGDPFAEPAGRYVGIDAYARAKLLAVLWTCQLAADTTTASNRALAGAFCANPGMAWTPNVRQLTRQAVPAWRVSWPVVRWMQRRASPARAARSPLHAATAPLEALAAGPYVDERCRARPIGQRLPDDGPRRAHDLAQRLIDEAPTGRPGSSA